MAKVVGLEAQVQVYMPRSPPFISANKTNDTQVNKGFHTHSCQKCCHENVPSSRKPEMDTLFLSRDDAAFKSHHSHRPIRLAHTTSPSDPNRERERERESNIAAAGNERLEPIEKGCHLVILETHYRPAYTYRRSEHQCSRSLSTILPGGMRNQNPPARAHACSHMYKNTHIQACPACMKGSLSQFCPA